MRVAILLNDMTANGGAPRQAMLLARWLQAFGHSARLYANRYCPENCYPEIGASLEIHAAERISLAALRTRGAHRHHGIVSGAQRHFWDSRQLARLVREPYDVLNPHVRGATRAAVECKSCTGAPVVWMCDDARNWEEPGYRPHYARPVQWCFDRVMALIEKPVVREIDRIVALDTRVWGILKRYYGRPVTVVRSGLDSSAFREQGETRVEIRARHNISEKDFLLLWLGILEPHRHIEDVFTALRLLRSRGSTGIRFLVAGSAEFSPQYARKLKELAKRYRLEDFVRFHFVRVPELEMAAYYSAADALVYLAENQCWGLGVFEALACNLAVIVSRACGAQEVLEDRRTALLVSPRDPNDLARAITELRENPFRRREMAREARTRVLGQITWETYARNMLRVFEEVRSEAPGVALPACSEVFA